MRLSPWAHFVHSRSAVGGEVAESHGVVHRLTGSAFTVPPPLRDLLATMAETPLSARDLLRLGTSPQVKETLDALVDAGLLVGDGTGADLLEPWLGHRWLKPLANPALLDRPPGRGPRLFLPDRLDLCRLPRRQGALRVVEQEVPEAAARLFAATGAGVTLGEALGALSGSGGRPGAEAWAGLDFVTRPERQLGRVAPPDADPLAAAPWHALFQSFERDFEPDPGSGDEAERSGHRFYASGVEDPAWNFDWGETTVSHAFRLPTAALGGRTYGQRFAERILADLPSPPPRPLRVLEVGGGLGHVARDLAGELRTRLAGGVRYRIVDRSPRLIGQQRRTLGDVDARWIVGDAESLGVKGGFDVVVANEMIADLSVETPVEGRPARQSGALAFVRRLAGLLAPGGRAYVVEYGGLDHAPRRVDHLDHPEHSVHFRPLLEAAEAAGLEAALEDLPRFLHLRGDTEMLCGQQEHLLCLRRLLSARGEGELPAFAAWDRQRLEATWGPALRGVIGPTFAPLDRGWHFGPAPADFHVLELARPG